MTKFGSLITAMITPFQASSAKEGFPEVDYVALEKLVEHLINTGSESIIISGTTGESPTLTHEEEHEIFKVVKAKANSLNPNVKIIFGAGSNSTTTVVNTAAKAKEFGADGLLIVTPYYNKPNQKGIEAHFSRIASSTDLPIILYNIPGRCVINMNAETIIKLAKEHKNIVGLKEASNNIDQISAIRQELSSSEFQIYSGDDSLTLAMMAVGADGVISVASHVVGNEMKTMMDSFNAGNLSQAQDIHKRLFPLFVALFDEPNPSCVKAALEELGICSENLREPLVKLDQAQKEALISTLKSVMTSRISA